MISTPSPAPLRPSSADRPEPAPPTRPADSDVVIEPLRRDEQGCGLYDVSAEMLVKELRASGVTAAFADPPESRLFNLQHSAWPDVVLTLVISLVSAGAVEAVKALVLRRAAGGAHLDVSITVVTAEGERREFSASGSGNDVIAVIDSLRGPGHDGRPGRDEGE